MPYSRTTWQDSPSVATAITAARLNNMEQGIVNAYIAGTGGLVNADIAVGAAIAYAKLALTGSILNADLAGSIAYSKLVLTGAILNADLAGSIAASKLASYPSDANKVLKGDGTWTYPPGYQYDYVAKTTSTSITNTTEGTAQTAITGTSLTYDTTPVTVSYFCPDWFTVPESTLVIVLLRGATVIAGSWGFGRLLTGTQTGRAPIYLEFADTSPPGGTYSYVVKSYISAGTGTLNAGAGGTGAEAPSFLRVRKI